MERIKHVAPENDYRVRITFETGDIVSVDFRPVIERGGRFAKLGDQQTFQQVAIGEYGRYIEWPGGIDFCADALRLGLGDSYSVPSNKVANA